MACAVDRLYSEETPGVIWVEKTKEKERRWIGVNGIYYRL
jgi:hypothetical protein